jgi:L,D-peptidoglycan transpeptidase YkuD (ErfK/YbiS/YcfS/YnhG family)
MWHRPEKVLGAAIVAFLAAVPAAAPAGAGTATATAAGAYFPLATATLHRTASNCPDNLADRLRTTDGAGQLITVESADFQATVAELAIWQRDGNCWEPAGGPWSGLIGENGFSNHHREGDGTTPTGIYRIGPIVYGNAPNPGFRGRYHRLVCGDWWDEDPTSPAYNTFQHVPCGQSPPFGGDSEALWTEGTYYPSFAVVEYNTRPVVPYAGSAIFVHADTGTPTTGCVSIPLPELDEFLRWLDPARMPTIAMAPASELTSF